MWFEGPLDVQLAAIYWLMCAGAKYFCITEILTRLCCAINTTFSERIYIRKCCIDRLSWQR